MARCPNAPSSSGRAGFAASPAGDFALPCLLVLRYLTEGEVHDKLALNDVLREHGIAP
ncbi:hypothetical protein BH20ACT3_BH20ACT3_00160 [soil metagenome]